MRYEQLYQGLVERLKRQPIEESQLGDILNDLKVLKKGALSNAVTGYPNGRQKDEDLPEIIENCEMERRKNKEERLYIAMLDLDYFGRFNKEYGHEVGDKVLKGVTEILEECLRGDDVITRLSKDSRGYHLHGEEMLVIYKCGSDEDAVKVGERIREAIKEKSREKMGYKVTGSIGVTRWKLFEEEYELAEKRADESMRGAKKEGRDRVCFE